MFIRKLFINAYVVLCRILCGIDKNKVLFESFHGKSYSDNPKAVSKCLHKSSNEIKIVWATRDVNNAKGVYPGYIKLVNRNNKLKFYMELATAAVFITNFPLPDVIKSKKQFFIQTWHGDRAFKKVLNDNEFSKDSFKLAESTEGFCNLAVAGSDYGEMQYRSAFLYKGEVVKEGTPRNDALVKKSISQINALKDEIGIDEDVKILLYAPTLRKKAHDTHTKHTKN